MDLETEKRAKIDRGNIKRQYRRVINWQPDSQSMLIKTLLQARKPLIDTSSMVPDGPTISNNYGAKAQNRTYQDLLKNKSDEHNFEQLATSSIHKVSLNGSKENGLMTQCIEQFLFHLTEIM